MNSSNEILKGVFVLGIGLLVMYVIRALCRYYVSCQGHVMGANMESDMRQDLFNQYQRLSFSYYDKHNTGVMMSRVVSDLFDICEFAHHGPENLFISLFKTSKSRESFLEHIRKFNQDFNWRNKDIDI